MYKYFNLISLLLCINLVFSYEYFDDATGRPFGKNFKRVRTSGKRKERHTAKQKYGYDKNAVEFDVARFIQPDEESAAEEENIKNRNQQRQGVSSNNDYSSLLGMNMEEGANNRESQDYLNFGDSPANLNPTLMDIGPPLLKDSMNIKQLKMDEGNTKYDENLKNLLKNQIVLPDQNPVHNPQKKCLLKNIKLPFFSRCNKSEPAKPKKNGKRKIFCFNCPKHKSKDNINQKVMQGDLISKDKKSKRSYEETLCPACKKRYLASNLNKRERPLTRRLHNKLLTDAIARQPSKDNLKKVMKFNPEVYRDSERNKREDPGILMRRELDVIQQTIEHEDVRMHPTVKSTSASASE